MKAIVEAAEGFVYLVRAFVNHAIFFAVFFLDLCKKNSPFSKQIKIGICLSVFLLFLAVY